MNHTLYPVILLPVTVLVLAGATCMGYINFNENILQLQLQLLTTDFMYKLIRHNATANVCILKITGYLYAYMGRLCMSTLIYSATRA